MKLIKFPLLLLIVWSCENNSKLIKDITPSSFKINSSFENAFVPVDSVGLAIYTDNPTVFENSANEFLVYWYNHTIHCIDVYNISAKKMVSRIKLSDDGPNGISSRIYQKFVYGPDSLFIMTGGKLNLINRKGILLKEWNTMFESIEGITNSGGYFHSPNEAKFEVSKNSKFMLGFFLHHSTHADVRNDESMQEYIIGKLNLETNDIAFLPIGYSNFIKYYSGDFSEIKPNVSFLDNRIVYNWPIESNIYSYDFASSEVTEIGAKSVYSDNFAPTQSERPGFNFINNGTWFNAVHKYPGKPYYYRTHWGSQPEKQLKGELSDALTKPGFIMIFDEQFKVIEEVEIPKNCHLDLSFATNEGVHFWAKDGGNENEMKFCRYTIR